jgi:hypothetical protein
MPEEKQISPYQKDLEEYIKRNIAESGFSPVVMKMWGIELKPEDYAFLNQLQNVERDFENWKKTPAAIKLFNHALSVLTFGLISNNAPPPEEAEKYGGWLYQQIDIPVLNPIYKFIVSDYGLSFAGLVEGFSFYKGGSLLKRLVGGPLLGLARKVGILEKVGLDKLVGAEIIKPLIPDSVYKVITESKLGQFAWDSFKLSLGMLPFGGYFRMREARWKGEDPGVKEWLEETFSPYNILTSVIGGVFFTGLGRGVKYGINRYISARLIDKGVEEIVKQWNIAIPEQPISKDMGRKIYKEFMEIIEKISKDFHTTPIGARFASFDPENVHKTLNNLQFLRQLTEPYIKLSPEELGKLNKVLDILKEHTQAYQLLKRYGIDELMPLFKRVEELSKLSGDDLGLNYLIKNPEELNIIKDLAPETVSKLQNAVSRLETLLRDDLFGPKTGSFLSEAAERIFGLPKQQMPEWSYNALKKVFGDILGSRKDTAKLSLEDKQRLTYLIFQRPDLVQALISAYPTTMGPLWERFTKLLDEVQKVYDEEILPLWKQLPDELKDIFINKEKSEILKGPRAEELGVRAVFDKEGNLMGVIPIERKSMADIEKELQRPISQTLNHLDTEQTKKLIENEFLPQYGEVVSELKKNPEKYQEFLYNFAKVVELGGGDTIRRWISEQPAFDQLVELADKVDKMSKDPFVSEFFDFVSKYSFTNKKFADQIKKMKFDTENKTALLKGVFALGIFEDERIMAYAYRIFQNPEAQRYFVSQYIKSYISGSLEEFFKKEYRNVYQFFRQAIKNLPKEYTPDNFSDAIRILANDENVVKMKAEIQTMNLGIDPFVSPSEFFRQLYEVHRHDFVRTTEATKEAIREVAQEEIAKTKTFEEQIREIKQRLAEAKKLHQEQLSKEPKKRVVKKPRLYEPDDPPELRPLIKKYAKEFPEDDRGIIDDIIHGRYKVNPGYYTSTLKEELSKEEFNKMFTDNPNAPSLDDVATNLVESKEFVAEKLSADDVIKMILDRIRFLKYERVKTIRNRAWQEYNFLYGESFKESSPMNLTVSPTFKVLEQFLGKDVNEVHNKIVSYLENTGFFEDSSKLNLTELSQIMPKITKKIADIESIPLIFKGKMFDIDTKKTLQEGERTMVHLVSLTGDKETIPITKEFALWLKYVAKTIENIEGRRPSIEEIIELIKEPFATGEGGISELEFLPY